MRSHFRPEPGKPYVLVRYCAPGEPPRWLAGGCPRAVIVARAHAEVLPALHEVERATRAGLTAVGFVAYEAAHGLDAAFPSAPCGLPLVWFGLYDTLHLLNAPGEVPSFEASPEEVACLSWQATVDPPAYERALQRIRAYIAAGDVYQVNYSFRLQASWQGDPLALFWQLYRAQPVPYAAYIDTGEHGILSLSPELFFALHGESILVRPMKGTAARGLTLSDDQQRAHALHSSEKNRAENLMIVDMVRNDLGRIATTGSVQVPRLFEVERYATLWQMTSTVAARTSAPLPAIFQALFPAASITGAPKIRATQIIHELETTPRGVYTGAVGLVLPGRRAQFNVAIRTLHYTRANGRLEYGIGSGVVWDSEQQAEYQECLTKAHLLLKPRPEFALLETLRWRAGKGYFLLEKHLQRLQRSAEYFGFEIAAEAIRRALPVFPPPARAGEGDYRVRLIVTRDGKVQVEWTPLTPRRRCWRVALAPEPVDPGDVFLYHKTTHRAVYERACAAYPHCDDVILWNTRGEITESTRANVVVKRDGRLWTPPVSSGLLAGVYREHLLEHGRIAERVLTLDDLRQAEAIYLINSVRGWLRATLGDCLCEE